MTACLEANLLFSALSNCFLHKFPPKPRTLDGFILSLKVYGCTGNSFEIFFVRFRLINGGNLDLVQKIMAI